MSHSSEPTELEADRPLKNLSVQGLPGSGEHSLSRYQAMLLEKLARMRRNRREYNYRPDAEDWIQKAMDRAIYSTFLECLNEGVGRQAKAILSEASEAEGIDAEQAEQSAAEL